MRLLLFIIMFLPGVAFAIKGNYAYDGILQVANGSDNFKLEQYAAIDKQGLITISRNSLTIDDKVFKIRPTDDRKIYKTRGGIVKFIYEQGELISIQIYRYNNLFHFDVSPTDDLVKK